MQDFGFDRKQVDLWMLIDWQDILVVDEGFDVANEFDDFAYFAYFDEIDEVDGFGEIDCFEEGDSLEIYCFGDNFDIDMEFVDYIDKLAVGRSLAFDLACAF